MLAHVQAVGIAGVFKILALTAVLIDPLTEVRIPFGQ